MTAEIYWTEEECNKAAAILAAWKARGEEPSWRKIGAELGTRSGWGVKRRYHRYGPTFAIRVDGRFQLRKERGSHLGQSRDFDRDPRTPEYVAAERDRRLAAEHTSITAAFFGDPLPGYSALDRRGE